MPVAEAASGKLTVLVTGATRKQGGHLVGELLARRHAVRALTRKPDSPAAAALAQRGVTIVPGDFEDQQRHIAYTALPVDAVRQQNEDLARMFEWFDRVGYDADVVGLRELYPEADWHRFSVWAREQDWSVIAVRATPV